MNNDELRILIIAEHASARFGGEAILPLHYFRNLRARGVEAWLIVHERTRAELIKLLQHDISRVRFIQDTRFQQWLSRSIPWAPPGVRHFSTKLLARLLNQREAEVVARRMIRTLGINVVHQPIPVSPREFSLLYDVGVPVLIGPMNGGISLPPALRGSRARGSSWFIDLGRLVSNAANRVFPGKLHAHALLVANARTREALPSPLRGRVITLVENAVDIARWPAKEYRSAANSKPVQFIFSGRLEEWKGVRFLLRALKHVREKVDARLLILGDGFTKASLQSMTRELGLENEVQFLGWKPQNECATYLRDSDVFVLPSYYECGGAVVLEAMASALPVIAANWGGPADYIDSHCGVLVDIESTDQFVSDLSAAMLRLAMDPSLRETMGRAGRERVKRHFTWDQKTGQIIQLYREAALSNQKR